VKKALVAVIGIILVIGIYGIYSKHKHYFIDDDKDGIVNARDKYPDDWRDSGYEPYGFCIPVELPFKPKSEIRDKLDLVKKCGVKYIREDFLWNVIEPVKGRFNFEKYDKLVKEASSKNIHILGLLCYSSDFAKSGPDKCFPPKYVEDYGDFVFQTVNRYKNKIKYWEIWNEPNILQFWKPSPNADKYVKLLKAGYNAAKKADPTCKILLGGLAGNGIENWGIGSSDFLQNIYSAGGKEYFDIVNIHPYEISYNTALDEYNLHLIKRVLDTETVMELNQDGDKIIWVTEIGSPNRKDTFLRQQEGSEETQAKTIKNQVESLLAYNKVEKVFIYSLGFRNDGFDLVDNNSKKKAYYEYKKLIKKYGRSRPNPIDISLLKKLKNINYKDLINKQKSHTGNYN